MSAADAFGLAISLLVLVYLVYALFRGERLLDERPGHLPDSLLRGRPRRAQLSARALHGPRLRRPVPRGRSVRLARGSRARLLPSRACGCEEGAGLEELRQDRAHLQRRLLRCALRHPAPAGAPVPEPRPHEGGARAPRAEHDRELHHEHELAVLRRRVHDVVPHPDGRARGAELRVCRRRDGGARSGRARDRAALRGNDSATSGSTSTGRSSTSSCPCRSSSRRS